MGVTMTDRMRAGLLALTMLATAACSQARAERPRTDDHRAYPWERRAAAYEALVDRLKPPEGFSRVEAKKGSYASWLRRLPLLPAGTPVRSYRGRTILRGDSKLVAAVVDLDLSKRDRQQCADTIMRLRGEYLGSRGRADRIKFRWGGGMRFGYAQWRKGQRPVKKGRKWKGVETKARACSGKRCLRRYLEFMFSWTGTLHLHSEPRVKDPKTVRAGDFFNRGGSPGHAAVILDLARDSEGNLRALIGHGYMPAQDMQVLRDRAGNAWFELDFNSRGVYLPAWGGTFRWKDLRRMKY